MLLTHPKVKDIAVVCMPDQVMGERACAYVILKPRRKFCLEEMAAFLRENRMASYKIPERLEIVDEFPLASDQKVLKRDLVKDVTEKLKAEGKLL